MIKITKFLKIFRKKKKYEFSAQLKGNFWRKLRFFRKNFEFRFPEKCRKTVFKLIFLVDVLSLAIWRRSADRKIDATRGQETAPKKMAPAEGSVRPSGRSKGPWRHSSPYDIGAFLKKKIFFFQKKFFFFPFSLRAGVDFVILRPVHICT